MASAVAKPAIQKLSTVIGQFAHCRRGDADGLAAAILVTLGARQRHHDAICGELDFVRRGDAQLCLALVVVMTTTGSPRGLRRPPNACTSAPMSVDRCPSTRSASRRSRVMVLTVLPFTGRDVAAYQRGAAPP